MTRGRLGMSSGYVPVQKQDTRNRLRKTLAPFQPVTASNYFPVTTSKVPHTLPAILPFRFSTLFFFRHPASASSGTIWALRPLLHTFPPLSEKLTRLPLLSLNPKRSSQILMTWTEGMRWKTTVTMMPRKTMTMTTTLQTVMVI
jgi:hypothetical protein